jgi:hypothetical protein
MTTFDKREQGFEAKFAHDEEIRFKALARCNKLVGDWAAAKLGLEGDAAVAYANRLVTANLERQTVEDTMRQVFADLAPRGISQSQVAQKMQECMHIALEQIASDKTPRA